MISPSFQATHSTILGYVFTKGIRPWPLNYYGTWFWMRAWRSQWIIAQSLLEVTNPYWKPNFLLHIMPCLPSKVVMRNSPTISTNIIHTCHMGFHVDFSSTRNVMDYNPKLPSRKPKVRACDTCKDENSRILKSHGLMAFVQTCPTTHFIHSLGPAWALARFMCN